MLYVKYHLRVRAAQVDVVPDRDMTAALTCEVYVVVCTPAGRSLSETEKDDDGWAARF